MALSKLNSLYKGSCDGSSSSTLIIQGRLDGVEQVNLNKPTCGDVISLPVQFDEPRVIEDGPICRPGLQYFYSIS